MGVTGKDTPFERLAANPVDPFSGAWTPEHSTIMWQKYCDNSHVSGNDCEGRLSDDPDNRRGISMATIVVEMKELAKVQSTKQLSDPAAQDRARSFLISEFLIGSFEQCYSVFLLLVPGEKHNRSG